MLLQTRRHPPRELSRNFWASPSAGHGRGCDPSFSLKSSTSPYMAKSWLPTSKCKRFRVRNSPSSMLKERSRKRGSTQQTRCPRKRSNHEYRGEGTSRVTSASRHRAGAHTSTYNASFSSFPGVWHLPIHRRGSNLTMLNIGDT